MLFNAIPPSASPAIQATSPRLAKERSHPPEELEALGRDVASFTTVARQKTGEVALGAERFVLAPYLNYAANLGADRFIHPTRHADGPAPDTYGIPFQTVHFTSKDGKTPLTGWYMPAAHATDKTVILSHGHGGQQGAEVRRFAKWLHEAGYNVLSFDYRNSGNSGGTHTTIGYEERSDLRAAVDLATSKGAKRIAVLGRSMGAATAIEEAADDPRVKAVISDCAFDTLYDAVLPRFENETQAIGSFKVHYPFPKLASQAIVQRVEQVTGEPLTSTDPLKEVRRLGDRPVLFIHGTKDNETLPQDSINLYNADPGPNKQLWMVPGATHGMAYDTDPKQYQKKVLDFLQSAFAHRPSP